MWKKSEIIMTNLGKRHKIIHPGYGQAGGFERDNNFWFADDIAKIIGSNRKANLRYQAKKKGLSRGI